MLILLSALAGGRAAIHIPVEGGEINSNLDNSQNLDSRARDLGAKAVNGDDTKKRLHKVGV